MARTGRRPGKQDTRTAILDAARKTFSERGYDNASIRTIATSAGVDPALVHHYFGNKEQLFLASIEAPINPAELMPHILEGGLEQAPERLVRVFLAGWSHPVTGRTAVALVRTALQHDWTARLLREFLITQIMRRVVAVRTDLDPAEATLRASLAVSQMLGLAMMRFILKVEPLASATEDQLVAIIAPTIRRYVLEPLPEAATTAGPADPSALALAVRDSLDDLAARREATLPKAGGRRSSGKRDGGARLDDGRPHQ